MSKNGTMSENDRNPIKNFDCSSNLLTKIFNYLKPSEQEQWKLFVIKHKKHGLHASGNGLSIKISPDSIGDYTILIQCSCGQEQNITDFSHW
jgi:hypothetical protein